MSRKIAEFYTFIKEREEIRLRKVAGLPFPWTQDKILQEYKFTNVRREYDRTTQELIKNFYSRDGQTSSHEEILFNCALFRYFGTYEFANVVKWQHKFSPNEIIKTAKKRLRNKERVFTGAYLVTNVGLKGPKEEIVVNVFLRQLWEKRKTIVNYVRDTNSWQETAKALSQIMGFGGTGFMAKETLLDTMHCNFWKDSLPTDYWEWTPVGPGARRGINRILEQDINSNISSSEMLKTILEITDQQIFLWPQEYGKLAPTDIQFQLCEFDKYQRVKLGEGRPRSRYHENSHPNV